MWRQWEGVPEGFMLKAILVDGKERVLALKNQEVTLPSGPCWVLPPCPCLSFLGALCRAGDTWQNQSSAIKSRAAGPRPQSHRWEHQATGWGHELLSSHTFNSEILLALL